MDVSFGYEKIEWPADTEEVIVRRWLDFHILHGLNERYVIAASLCDVSVGSPCIERLIFRCLT